MKLLVITGDQSFKAGNPRFDLQAFAVERLEALYWGPGALWPSPKSNSYDTVSTQDPFWRGLLGLFLARRFKARFNVQVHADLKAQPLFKRFLARFVLRRAHSIRVVSPRIKSQVEEMGVAVPITVLPIFIDIERFKKIERKLDAHPTVLWVGRFEDEKDPLLALRVFRQILEKGIDARLIMLGAGKLEARLKKESVGFPVEFPGWQDTIPFLARASVVLSTSKAESYGASIVEALAAGVPVVAPDVGIASEAGTIVSEREHLAEVVVKALRTKPRVCLTLPLLSRSAWVAAWRRTLL